MIVHQRNVFINAKGRQFEIPNDYINVQGGFSQIIEFCNKVVIKFSGIADTKTRNIISFDRSSGDVLWLIEEGRIWIPPSNRNMYLADYLPDEVVHYSLIDALYLDDSGDTWIEEVYRKSFKKTRPAETLEENKIVARHPAYHNDQRYRYVEADAYWVRSDTHELETRDMDAESSLPQPGERGHRSMKERGYSGVVFYADMTAHREEDCLLVALSAVDLSYEVDMQSGKVTPAFAVTTERK